MRLLGLLILLALLLLACAAGGHCGTLVRTCGSEEIVIMAGVKDLEQNVSDHVRYYRFWDCALEEWAYGDCPAACTVEVKWGD